MPAAFQAAGAAVEATARAVADLEVDPEAMAANLGEMERDIGEAGALVDTILAIGGRRVTDAVDVGGCRIAYRVLGPADGPGLVLTHSIGWDHSMWAPQIEALGADYRIVAVDTRGHGQSGSPPGPYSLEMLAGDVLAAAKAAGLERFHHRRGVDGGADRALDRRPPP